jgi:hypothetical protein
MRYNNDILFEENTKNLPPMYLPCGGVAYFDVASGIAYRCELCGAVVGSIGQPQECKDEQQKWDNWKKLGGKGWDPITGESEK